MKRILKYIAIIILLWVAASSTIQRFKFPVILIFLGTLTLSKA